MPLTEDQKEWLASAIGKADSFGADLEKATKRGDELEKIAAEVAQLQNQLAVAGKALKATKEVTFLKVFTRTKSLDYLNGDPDSELDTGHDVNQTTRIDQEAVKEITRLHGELLKLQTRMEKATFKADADSKDAPLFSPRDIERELWSPLVQAGIIPSNAVADKYSQGAQVFNGACEIYHEKLVEHTKSASKHETAKIWLKRTADFTAMAGTMATESIKAAHFSGMSIDKADTDKYTVLNGKDKTSLTAEETEFVAKHKERLADLATANRDLAAATAATTFVQSVVTVTDTALNKPDKKYTWKLAETVFDEIGKNALSSLALAGKEVEARDLKRDNKIGTTQNFKTSMGSAQRLVSYGFKAGKVVFRFQELLEAPDEETRKAAAMGIVKSIAGAMAHAFAAFDVAAGNAVDKDGKPVKGPDGKDLYLNGTNGQWAKVGAIVESAIVGAANIGLIARQAQQMVQSGKAVNPGALAAAIGISVITPIMVGMHEIISDSVRKDVDKAETSSGGARAFEETTGNKSDKARREEAQDPTDMRAMSEKTELGEKASKLSSPAQALKDKQKKEAGQAGKTEKAETDEAADKALATALDQLKGMDLILADMPDVDADLAEARIGKAALDADIKDRKEAVAAFKKQLADPNEQQKFYDSIQKMSDEEAARLDELIEAASVSADDLAEDEAKAKKAMASIDKLIGEAKDLNDRWALIETLTSGGVGILVAALPVAGLAAAIQRMAMDIAVLVRKSLQLNTWVENMALTWGNNSVYGPAIKGRLTSASVQVSQQAVRVIFDAVGVAAESAKLADCMGVATGLSIGNNMARALTEYGYKLHKEIEIEKGWALYKQARDTPSDRKLARKAMQWNSTLSKCVLAYGIVIDGDPIAKEVGRKCGLTPEILADQKNVCGKVVTYFQTLYSDDPVVLRRIPVKKDWHPGQPELTLDSWMRFKAAAISRAVPPMDAASAASPAVDNQLAVIARLEVQRTQLGVNIGFDLRREFDPLVVTNYTEVLEQLIDGYRQLFEALRKFAPLNGPAPEGAEASWSVGVRHESMLDVAGSLIAQAQLAMGEADVDLRMNKRISETREELEDA